MTNVVCLDGELRRPGNPQERQTADLGGPCGLSFRRRDVGGGVTRPECDGVRESKPRSQGTSVQQTDICCIVHR
jgi:hypothetical protein